MIPGRLPPEKMFPAGDARFSTRFVALPSGLRLRVIECGPDAATDVVLCVHGWACSVYSFRFIMPLLAEHGVRTIAVDLPGHGLSDKPDDASVYTLDSLVRTVAQAMDAVAVPRAVLAGHSMGGPICARLAVVAPERVAGLALLAPVGFGSAWTTRIAPALAPRLVASLLPHVMWRWLFELVLWFANGRIHRVTSRDVDEYWAPSQFPGFARALWDLLRRFDWSAGREGEFAALSVPTQVLDGTLDNFVVRRWVRCYARVLRHATFTSIPECGHVVPEEAPEAVCAAILSLIR